MPKEPFHHRSDAKHSLGGSSSSSDNEILMQSGSWSKAAHGAAAKPGNQLTKQQMVKSGGWEQLPGWDLQYESLLT